MVKKIKEFMALAITLFFLFLGMDAKVVCSAQTPSISQIQRSQEILEKEKALREKIEQGEKVFIKKIIVKGATQLSEDQIKEIILPYQKKWLTKDDIQRLVDSLKEAYQKQAQGTAAITYRVEGRNLIIEVTQEKR